MQCLQVEHILPGEESQVFNTCLCTGGILKGSLKDPEGFKRL